MMVQTRRPGRTRLRVGPAGRGQWRVEDGGSVRAVCATPGEADRVAERILRECGEGEILAYDAYMRLRSVKRVSRAATP
jgi:hypothetical protein